MERILVLAFSRLFLFIVCLSTRSSSWIHRLPPRRLPAFVLLHSAHFQDGTWIRSQSTPSSPRQWLESQPDGAYTVLRCDSSGSCQGRSFHLNRLQDSYNTFLQKRNDTAIRKDIVVRGASVLDSLLQNGLAFMDTTKADTQSSTWMVTLLAHPHATKNNDVTIKGHLYETQIPAVRKGVSIALVEGNGNLPTRQPYPQAKLSSWCRERKLLEELTPEGTGETILLDPNSNALLEGLTSNLFVYRSDNKLQTASAEMVLGGFVRHLVLESGAFDVTCEPIYTSDAASWKCIFLTSSIRFIIPVSKVVCADQAGETHEVWTEGLESKELMTKIQERLAPFN